MATPPADVDGLRAFRGSVLDFTDDPRHGDASIRFVEDGLLLVRSGRVEAVVDASSARVPAGTPIEDRRGCLIIPGFIDAHVHYVQTDVIASPGRQLLDWLSDYTFPAEGAFAKAPHAEAVAEFFLDELLKNGTTTAAVFPSVHKCSVDAFFNAAQRRRLRMVAGKVLMDRNCPDTLRDSADSAYEDSAELIQRWHGVGRLDYAVTPRFAATSTERQLELAGRLLDEHPGVRMQTHIAENHDEIRWVAELFPWSRSYLEIYERYGLARPGALFAHCIHFGADDWKRFAATGSAAVHCPTSNLFLGSGLFNYDAALSAGAAVALATDVGGGTSFSMLRTMHEAYKVARMGGVSFSARDAFYLATLGGAKALGLDQRIGSFETGREADFVVLDPCATPLMERRMRHVKNLDEKLFVMMMLGDERTVRETYILGERWNG